MTFTGLCGSDMNCYSSDMNRRTTTNQVASNVRNAIVTAGATPEMVAQATDMQVSEVESRLRAETPFSFTEILRVGGFLRIPADSLLKETAA